MSTKLIFSAAASTLAMCALAVGAPSVVHGERNGASSGPMMAAVPAPSSVLPAILRR